MEQFIRLLLHCGAPADDFDFISGAGTVVNEVLLAGNPRSTLFTGGTRVAEKLASDLKGKVRL